MGLRIKVGDHVQVQPTGASGRLVKGKRHPHEMKTGIVTEIRTIFVPQPVAHIKLDSGDGIIFVSLEFLEVV